MILILLVYLIVAMIGAGIAIYGLVLAFKSSIVLGIITFVVSPAALVFGAVKIFGKTDLPSMIQEKVHFPA